MGLLRLGNTHPSEIDTPPPSLNPPPSNPWSVGGVLSGDRTPPLYVYTQRREPHMGPSFLMAPDDQLGARDTDLNIGWHEAPEPIRQSPYYAEGHKVHPDAHVKSVQHTAIGSIEAVMEDRFQVGKLLGYLYRPMYAGKQKPSMIRANIQEPVPTTYGSLYEIRGVQPIGGVVTPSGFSVQPLESPTSSTVDGYPY